MCWGIQKCLSDLETPQMSLSCYWRPKELPKKLGILEFKTLRDILIQLLKIKAVPSNAKSEDEEDYWTICST